MQNLLRRMFREEHCQDNVKTPTSLRFTIKFKDFKKVFWGKCLILEYIKRQNSFSNNGEGKQIRYRATFHKLVSKEDIFFSLG